MACQYAGGNALEFGRYKKLLLHSHNPANMPEYRLMLNNYIQRNPAAGALTWDCTSIGPRHAPEWTVIARINGVEYGRGVAQNQGVAKEAAAQQACAALGIQG